VLGCAAGAPSFVADPKFNRTPEMMRTVAVACTTMGAERGLGAGAGSETAAAARSQSMTAP